jgi:hypothetical protein
MKSCDDANAKRFVSNARLYFSRRLKGSVLLGRNAPRRFLVGLATFGYGGVARDQRGCAAAHERNRVRIYLGRGIISLTGTRGALDRSIRSCTRSDPR